MKPPVHSIQQAGEALHIQRLKPPRFTATYVAGALRDVVWQAPAPANADAYYKKAIAAAKNYQ